MAHSNKPNWVYWNLDGPDGLSMSDFLYYGAETGEKQQRYVRLYLSPRELRTTPEGEIKKVEQEINTLWTAMLAEWHSRTPAQVEAVRAVMAENESDMRARVALRQAAAKNATA
jgi:hypothetical protein